MADISGTTSRAKETARIGRVSHSRFPIHPAIQGAPANRRRKKRKPVKVSVTDETMKTRRAPASSPSASRSDTNLEMARGKPAVARISSVLYRGYTC